MTKTITFSRKILTFLMLLSFVVGIGATRWYYSIVPLPQPDLRVEDIEKEFAELDFDLFLDVWKKLTTEYVDAPVEQKKLYYGALAGLVAGLGDPHSIFFDPQTAQDFKESLNGEFEGIGAEIGIKNNQLTVIAPLDGSPAHKAGLRPGDDILAIDKVDTRGLLLDQAVKLIRGPKNSKVTLTIRTKRDKMIQEIEILRDTILVESVKTSLLPEAALIKVGYFDDKVANLIKKGASDFRKKNLSKIILDLRNNPGGYLDSAVDTASLWIENGVVVSERGQSGEKNEYTASGSAILKNFQTIILVNEASASASEIVAGALRDSQHALLIGMKTFGKGSVQSYEELSDGSALKLTIAKWFTPSGQQIDGTGITPDVVIDLQEDDFNNDRDPQMAAALHIAQSCENINDCDTARQYATARQEEQPNISL